MSQVFQPGPPSLANDSSMLSRRFGKEAINYYGGGLLNRFSFLRGDAPFLRRAATSPSARFVALRDLNPLVEDARRLAFFKLDEVKPLLSSNGQGGLFEKTDEERTKEFDSTRKSPLVLFLGLLPDAGSLGVDLETSKHGVVNGQPFFAVDVTPKAGFKEAAEEFARGAEGKGYSVQTNVRTMTLDPEGAAILAQARSLLDWNARNSFCAGCGKPNLSVESGYKRVCPPTDFAGSSSSSPQARDDCPTRHGVSNVCFPRTDPTMIVAVVSADGQRMLLGRQSRWPPKWHSTLAGFIEPGESIEDSVRREVWEEAGVRVGRVVIQSSQPWPYPSSLMIGAVAQALPDGEEIALLDKELEAASWFSFDEVREALRNGTSALGDPVPEGYEGKLCVPPRQAIAHQLMQAVVDGYLDLTPKI
ncbi:Peroxisomal NADH pyrophosphatase NUDT12 [Trichoderma ghanense]|uniref:NAD(+) diphosphatase n=1 Tax=Trichoderma ghanense TaxID=65468 RepID=A0ABY2H0L8_9HYPO